MALFGMAALGSCQADMDDPGLKDPQATIKANITIADFKAKMWQDDTNYAILCPKQDDGTDYIIRGYVTSSDASGNIYKSLYIQDETGAITLSINQNSLFNQYRVGQEVIIDVTGLYVGKYAGLEQIGGYGEYNGTPQVSFMTYESFVEHAQVNGLPVLTTNYINMGDQYPVGGPYCIRTTIGQINGMTSAEEVQAMQSQFVELQNVSWEGGGVETYAPYEESVSRNLTDASGQTIIVRNSGYATFYNQVLPKGTGNVRGMLSYYNGSWQIVLRSAADCLFDSKGTEEEPYTVEEAIELQNTGAAGWVQGYIVGAVKAGVTSVTSNNDIDWNASDPTDNNLVIGATADTKDINKVVILPLAQGSDLRRVGNLADNPQNLGKKISAYGALATVLDIAGLTGNNGTTAEFKIDGVTVTPDNPDNPGTGNGTEDSPYTVMQLVNGASGNGVWVNCYIVGFISTTDTGANTLTATSAKFTASGAIATNILVADSPNETDYTKCTSVQLPSGAVRSAINLADNPGNLGRQVLLYGNIAKYFGVNGLKEVSQYKWKSDNGGGDQGTETTILTALVNDANGWTFDNVNLPSNLSYIWQWKVYNNSGYLNGSAYTDKAYASEAYAISSNISLSGYTSVSLTFDHAAKFQTTLKSLCGVAVREAGQTSWTMLDIPNWPEAGAWTFANSGTIDLSAYAGKTIQLAFKYGSTASGADTWEIKNLVIKGKK